MLANHRFTDLPAYSQLKAHYETISDRHLRDLFAEDPDRFPRFTRQFEDILLDFSKNRITDETLSLLLQLAEQKPLGKCVLLGSGGVAGAGCICVTPLPYRSIFPF